MQKRYRFFLSFLCCLALALILFSLQKTWFFTGFSRLTQSVFAPLQRSGYSLVMGFPWIGQKEKIERQKAESDQYKELASFQTVIKDNQALKDQFDFGASYQSQLLAARVIGAPRFLPGVSSPEVFILDKGTTSGVSVGQGVVFRDQVVGKITKVGPSSAVATLVTNPRFSLPVRTARNSALGVVKGTGAGDMLLDNVLLSEELQIGDVVVTYGDVQETGVGLPPDIIVGKIVSVDKKPSALFQTAKLHVIQPLEKLTLVFIVRATQ